jgi:hypothetical protein
LMVFSTINLVYIVSTRPLKTRVENNIEIFNEFCILGCTYVLNVFLNIAAPPQFMGKMGWVFMGIAIFNILTNIVITGIMMLVEVLEHLAEKREEKKKQEIIEERIKNLEYIVESKVGENVDLLLKEVLCHRDIIYMRKWYPH